MRLERIAALTGVAFVVVAIIGGIIGGDPPDAESPVQEIVDHYADNKTSIQVGAFVGVAAMVLLVFFGAYLRSVLSAAEGRGGILSALTLVGAAIVAVGFAIDVTITVALTEAVDDIEPGAVQALQALWDNDFVPIVLGILVFLIATGLSILRHGALPKWLGWVALVLAVIGFTPIGFVAFLGTGLWIVIVSVLLAVRAQPAAP
ncbi:MAG TPA: hypothetical protein VK920_06550 [Solirubrobacterales bacterium]|nr:hypothetical protein [Solirubrobacterales bacterium]